jgi:hypothetical protein
LSWQLWAYQRKLKTKKGTMLDSCKVPNELHYGGAAVQVRACQVLVTA